MTTRDWKNFFTASDFQVSEIMDEIERIGGKPARIATEMRTQFIADRANALLAEAIENAPRVYGLEKTAMGETWIAWDEGVPPPIVGVMADGLKASTHTARLIDIQPIANTKEEE